MKKLSTNLTIVLGGIALVSAAMGVDWHYNSRFASTDKVDEVEEKVDLVSVSLRQQILQQRLDRLNDQILEVIMKHGEDPNRMPAETKRIYLKLLDDKAKLLREWDTIVIKK